MADRGKIVSGMECCVNGEHSECPYRDRDNDNGMLKCWNELMRGALELLKEQEPVTLIQAEKVESHRWEIVKIYCCGNCGLEFNHYGWKYCPYCGRKAKLDE